ncbi:DUF6807 family protein [Limisphaera sp. VF-2]|jgi:hypothetical protein|uniref:DUF6807 family protein n=1 Tax=Limisphaera sp. VF-2 TaxID=3400418 RepID=UPI003C2BF104
MTTRWRRLRPQRWVTGTTASARAAARALGLAAMIWAAAPVPGQTQGGFRFGSVNETSLGLWEGERPVLVYNHGVIRRPGVAEHLARSTYVHPLYGLDGEVLTDDFPSDHLHHRGLFWAWPHVRIGEAHYDLWLLRGIRQQFERWIRREATNEGARLEVENGWYVGADKVVAEEVRFHVHPAREDARAVDVAFTWTVRKGPLTLQGAEGKSYGGLTLRFAPGTNTTITIPAGRISEDLPMTHLPWADLTRLWEATRQTSGAAIFVAPDHPDYPPQWLLRHYGVLCLGWPGVQAATFAEGQTIRARYRIWIHRGAVSADRLRRAYEEYCRELSVSR